MYVSPAHKTSTDCPAGPSVARLDVITAVLLPLLCEMVSSPAPAIHNPIQPVRDKSSPISDHKSSSTVFFALLFPSSDGCGSDHLSTRRKLNLRRVPPGVDPATRSAAIKSMLPQQGRYCRDGKRDMQANDNPQQLKLLSTDTSRLEEKNQTSAMESRLVFTTHTCLRGGDYLSWTPSAVPVPERGSIDPIPIPEDRPGARSLLHVWNGAFSPSSQSPACRDVSRPNATGRGGTGWQIGRSADLVRSVQAGKHCCNGRLLVNRI